MVINKEEGTRQQALDRAEEIVQMLSKILPEYRWEAVVPEEQWYINNDEFDKGDEGIKQYRLFARAETDLEEEIWAFLEKLDSFGIMEMGKSYGSGYSISHDETYENEVFSRLDDMSDFDIGRIEELASAIDRKNLSSQRSTSFTR